MPTSRPSEVELALERLAQRLTVVSAGTVPISQAAGRVLAAPLVADRSSPPLDVSAMDGYAIRLADAGPKALPVVETTVAGAPPTTLPPGAAVRIFTGAPVPAGAECVVRREDTTEHPQQVEIRLPANALSLGQNIRRRGENVQAGNVVLEPGLRLNATSMAAVASFGAAEVTVRRPLRVAVLNTGDELADPGAPVEAWQIRDSNGPTLQAWLDGLSWVEVVERRRVADDLPAIRHALVQLIAISDAVILTGGVSMGDTDYVPQAIAEAGGEIVFHRLPIRPGKPVLGAYHPHALILGLPGNPVSVAVTARVIAQPLLERLAGVASLPAPLVEVQDADDRRLPLTWYRLVDIESTGRVRLSATQGSGDLVSLARSAGFVHVAPDAAGRGPWPLTLW